jgi:hypothetical protein
MAFRTVAFAAVLLVSACVAGPASASISPYVETVAEIGPYDDYLALYDYGQGTWTEVGPAPDRVYLGGPGLFAIDPATGDINRYDGTPGQWSPVGGPGAEFAIGGSHLYGLGPSENYVAEWNGTGQSWTVIGGPAAGIAAGGAGLVASTPSRSAVYRYNGTPGSWTQIGGAGVGADQLYVNDEGVYAVSSTPGNAVIERWNGSGQNWTVIGTGFSDWLWVGGDRVYANSATTGDIEQYDGTPGAWTDIGPPGEMFAVSQTALYALAPDSSSVSQYEPGVGWTKIGGPADSLAAGG